LNANRNSAEGRVAEARNEALLKQQILLWLDSVVRKVSIFASGMDVEFRVIPPESGTGAYLIEASKGRYARRVRVEARAIERRRQLQVDPTLVRDLRSAVSSVVRMAQQREE
jgi:hypothetical protein